MANIKLPDLDTRSVLHVAQKNFESVGLKTLAIRLLYTGEHTLTKEEIIHKFKKSIDYTNSGYTDIPVNGLLLVYDSYFVHIIEGSEDTIFRQLRILFNIERHWIEKMKKKDEEVAAAAAEETDTDAAAKKTDAAAETAGNTAEEEPQEPQQEYIMFRRLKMLIVYHSITTLLFNDWRALTARPPSLVGSLDVYAPIEDHMEQLHICIDKLKKLCELAKEDINLSFEGLSANDPKIEALPEVTLLDYLLTSAYTLDLREMVSYHRWVEDHVFYFEQVWPLPTAFTPRHLYKLKIDDSFVDPLPVMPWEIQEREEQEAREREEGITASSSSD